MNGNEEFRESLIGELRKLIKESPSIEDLLREDRSSFSRTLGTILSLSKLEGKDFAETIEEISRAIRSAQRDKTLSTEYVKDLTNLKKYLDTLSELSEAFSLLHEKTGIDVFAQVIKDLPDTLQNAGKGLGEFSRVLKQFLFDLQRETSEISEFSFKELARLQLYRNLAESRPISAYYLQPDINKELFRRYYAPDVDYQVNLKAFQDFSSVFLGARNLYRQLPISERLFVNPRSTFLEQTQREFLAETVNSLTLAKNNLIQNLSEINKKLEEEESPEKRAELLEKRFEYIKNLTNVYKEEISLRNELNKEFRNFISTIRSFGEREIDTILSITRNPFVDIFTSSLRTGIQVGTSVYSALSELFLNSSIGMPVSPGGRGTGSGRPTKPGQEETKPTTVLPTNNQRTFLGKTGLALGAGLFLDFGINTLQTGNVKEALKETFSIENLLKFGASSLVAGGVSLIPGGALLAPFAGMGTYYLLDKLFPSRGQTERELALKEKTLQTTEEANKSLSNLASSALGAGTALGVLGVGALAFSSGVNNKLRIAPGEALALGGGVLAGAVAFGLDFYLQTVNKAYDTYYSRFVQARLLPQQIREQLGTNVADISGQFAPGGRVFPARMGFTPEEYMATSARLFATIGGLTTNLNNFNSALYNSARVANLFGVSIADAVNLISTSRKALMEERLAIRGAYLLGGEFSAFTKAFSEAIVSASTSLAIRQGINPSDYFRSFLSFQTVFFEFSNRQLAEFARRNPELLQQAVTSFNEFIRGGLSGNAVSLGIGIRAGMTPLDIQRGATPQNLFNLLQRLSIETGLVSQFIGGRFTPQAQNFLIPILQQILGFSNISPEVFRTLMASGITGDYQRARQIVERELGKPFPTVRTPDQEFAEQIDVLNGAMQVLVNTFKENTSVVVDLNKNITTLAAVILAAGSPLGRIAIGGVKEALDLLANENLIALTKPENKKILEYLNAPKETETTNIKITGNVPAGVDKSSLASLPKGTYVILVNGEISNVPLNEFVENVKKGK